MNAYLRKEIRPLLPSFRLALLLAASNCLVPIGSGGANEIWSALPFVFCPLAVLFFVLNAFGVECGSNLFGNLLAQPISRSRIWWTKSLLALAGVGTVLVIWWISFAFGRPGADLPSVMLGTGVTAVVIYSGGLWTMLLFRQAAVAFWFVLLVPGLLMAMATHQFEYLRYGEALVASVLMAYSVVGFLFAWRLFLRAEDVQWTGGAITFPDWLRRSQRAQDSHSSRTRRPLRSVFFKELHLHQSQFLMAGVLALLHLVIIFMRNFDHAMSESYPALDVLYNCFWVLWLVMPWLVGCAAVAEERKLGTLEAQLGAPVSRRRQFLIKFATAMLIAILLGTIMPFLLDGNRVAQVFGLGENSAVWRLADSLMQHLPSGPLQLLAADLCLFIARIDAGLVLAAISVGVAALSFYASSFARNTLQALAPALVGLYVAAVSLFLAGDSSGFLDSEFWRSLLFYVLGLPALSLTLAELAYWNFQQSDTGWPVWRRNLIVVLAVAVLVPAITTAILGMVNPD